ncbi:DUF6944 family repetitive protein [Scopulibacillus cellulosilyticus]|uniref:DUF6944 family repetitive protein n=1 Tax=Scopulibacillus cellulosilyticus TaxID=2665665 RepID=A0ABW2Q1C5_9BACL
MNERQKAVTKRMLQKLESNGGLNLNNEYPPGTNETFTGTWIQVMGAFLEAVGVTKELRFLRRQSERLQKGDTSDLTSEEKAVLGVWLQTIGKTFGAVGFSKQLSEKRSTEIQGRKLSIIGNWMSAYGSSLEAIAETELLIKEEATQVPF